MEKGNNGIFYLPGEEQSGAGDFQAFLNTEKKRRQMTVDAGNKDTVDYNETQGAPAANNAAPAPFTKQQTGLATDSNGVVYLPGEIEAKNKETNKYSSLFGTINAAGRQGYLYCVKYAADVVNAYGGSKSGFAKSGSKYQYVWQHGQRINRGDDLSKIPDGAVVVFYSNKTSYGGHGEAHMAIAYHGKDGEVYLNENISNYKTRTGKAGNHRTLKYRLNMDGCTYAKWVLPEYNGQKVQQQQSVRVNNQQYIKDAANAFRDANISYGVSWEQFRNELVRKDKTLASKEMTWLRKELSNTLAGVQADIDKKVKAGKVVRKVDPGITSSVNRLLSASKNLDEAFNFIWNTKEGKEYKDYFVGLGYNAGQLKNYLKNTSITRKDEIGRGKMRYASLFGVERNLTAGPNFFEKPESKATMTNMLKNNKKAVDAAKRCSDKPISAWSDADKKTIKDFVKAVQKQHPRWDANVILTSLGDYARKGKLRDKPAPGTMFELPFNVHTDNVQFASFPTTTGKKQENNTNAKPGWFTKNILGGIGLPIAIGGARIADKYVTPGLNLLSRAVDKIMPGGDIARTAWNASGVKKALVKMANDENDVNRVAASNIILASPALFPEEWDKTVMNGQSRVEWLTANAQHQGIYNPGTTLAGDVLGGAFEAALTSRVLGGVGNLAQLATLGSRAFGTTRFLSGLTQAVGRGNAASDAVINVGSDIADLIDTSKLYKHPSGFWQTLANSAASGVLSLAQNDAQRRQDMERMSQLSAMQSQIAVPHSVEMAQEKGLMTRLWQENAQGRGEILTNLTAQSFISSLPMLVGSAVTGNISAAGTGRMAQTLGRLPQMINAFRSSYGIEYSSAFMEALGDAGVDTTDATALADAYDNHPELIEKARRFAMLRGVPIGAFDALAVLLPGMVFGSNSVSRRAVLRNFVAANDRIIQANRMTRAGQAAARFNQGVKTVAEKASGSILDGMLGGLGEISAQIATGKKLTDLDWFEGEAEILGEVFPGGFIETTVVPYQERRRQIANMREAMDGANLDDRLRENLNYFITVNNPSYKKDLNLGTLNSTFRPRATDEAVARAVLDSVDGVDQMNRGDVADVRYQRNLRGLVREYQNIMQDIFEGDITAEKIERASAIATLFSGQPLDESLTVPQEYIDEAAAFMYDAITDETNPVSYTGEVIEGALGRERERLGDAETRRRQRISEAQRRFHTAVRDTDTAYNEGDTERRQDAREAYYEQRHEERLEARQQRQRAARQGTDANEQGLQIADVLNQVPLANLRREIADADHEQLLSSVDNQTRRSIWMSAARVQEIFGMFFDDAEQREHWANGQRRRANAENRVRGGYGFFYDADLNPEEYEWHAAVVIASMFGLNVYQTYRAIVGRPDRTYLQGVEDVADAGDMRRRGTGDVQNRYFAVARAVSQVLSEIGDDNNFVTNVRNRLRTNHRNARWTSDDRLDNLIRSLRQQRYDSAQRNETLDRYTEDAAVKLFGGREQFDNLRRMGLVTGLAMTLTGGRNAFSVENQQRLFLEMSRLYMDRQTGMFNVPSEYGVTIQVTPYQMLMSVNRVLGGASALDGTLYALPPGEPATPPAGGPVPVGPDGPVGPLSDPPGDPNMPSGEPTGPIDPDSPATNDPTNPDNPEVDPNGQPEDPTEPIREQPEGCYDRSLDVRDPHGQPTSETDMLTDEALNKALDANQSNVTPQSIPFEALNFDPTAFQFRVDGTKEGVTENFTITPENWNAQSFGNVVVWRDLSGKIWVVDGHHRVTALRKLKEQGVEIKDVNCVFLNDVYTSQMAKIMGLVVNMNNGNVDTAYDLSLVARQMSKGAQETFGKRVGSKSTKPFWEDALTLVSAPSDVVQRLHDAFGGDGLKEDSLISDTDENKKSVKGQSNEMTYWQNVSKAVASFIRAVKPNVQNMNELSSTLTDDKIAAIMESIRHRIGYGMKLFVSDYSRVMAAVVDRATRIRATRTQDQGTLFGDFDISMSSEIGDTLNALARDLLQSFATKCSQAAKSADDDRKAGVKNVLKPETTKALKYLASRIEAILPNLDRFDYVALVESNIAEKYFKGEIDSETAVRDYCFEILKLAWLSNDPDITAAGNAMGVPRETENGEVPKDVKKFQSFRRGNITGAKGATGDKIATYSNEGFKYALKNNVGKFVINEYFRTYQSQLTSNITKALDAAGLNSTGKSHDRQIIKGVLATEKGKNWDMQPFLNALTQIMKANIEYLLSVPVEEAVQWVTEAYDTEYQAALRGEEAEKVKAPTPEQPTETQTEQTETEQAETQTEEDNTPGFFDTEKTETEQTAETETEETEQTEQTEEDNTPGLFDETETEETPTESEPTETEDPFAEEEEAKTDRFSGDEEKWADEFVEQSQQAESLLNTEPPEETEPVPEGENELTEEQKQQGVEIDENGQPVPVSEEQTKETEGWEPNYDLDDPMDSVTDLGLRDSYDEVFQEGDPGWTDEPSGFTIGANNLIAYVISKVDGLVLPTRFGGSLVHYQTDFCAGHAYLRLKTLKRLLNNHLFRNDVDRATSDFIKQTIFVIDEIDNTIAASDSIMNINYADEVRNDPFVQSIIGTLSDQFGENAIRNMLDDGLLTIAPINIINRLFSDDLPRKNYGGFYDCGTGACFIVSTQPNNLTSYIAAETLVHEVGAHAGHIGVSNNGMFKDICNAFYDYHKKPNEGKWKKTVQTIADTIRDKYKDVGRIGKAEEWVAFLSGRGAASVWAIDEVAGFFRSMLAGMGFDGFIDALTPDDISAMGKTAVRYAAALINGQDASLPEVFVKTLSENDIAAEGEDLSALLNILRGTLEKENDYVEYYNIANADDLAKAISEIKSLVNDSNLQAVNDALNTALERYRDKYGERGPAYSRKAPSDATKTKGYKIKGSIDARFGKGTTAAMLASGKLAIVKTQAEARSATGKGIKFSENNTVIQGFTDDTGKVTLVEDGINEGDEVAVFLHEEGVHAGKLLLNDTRFNALTDSLKRRANQNNATGRAIQKAMDRAKAAGMSQADTGFWEEVAAYMVEDADLNIGIVDRAVGLFKHFLFRVTGNSKIADRITTKDLVVFADSAVRSAVADAKSKTAGQRLGRQKQTVRKPNTPAERNYQRYSNLAALLQGSVSPQFQNAGNDLEERINGDRDLTDDEVRYIIASHLLQTISPVDRRRGIGDPFATPRHALAEGRAQAFVQHIIELARRDYRWDRNAYRQENRHAAQVFAQNVFGAMMALTDAYMDEDILGLLTEGDLQQVATDVYTGIMRVYEENPNLPDFVGNTENMRTVAGGVAMTALHQIRNIADERFRSSAPMTDLDIAYSTADAIMRVQSEYAEEVDRYMTEQTQVGERRMSVNARLDADRAVMRSGAQSGTHAAGNPMLTGQRVNWQNEVDNADREDALINQTGEGITHNGENARRQQGDAAAIVQVGGISVPRAARMRSQSDINAFLANNSDAVKKRTVAYNRGFCRAVDSLFRGTVYRKPYRAFGEAPAITHGTGETIATANNMFNIHIVCHEKGHQWANTVAFTAEQENELLTLGDPVYAGEQGIVSWSSFDISDEVRGTDDYRINEGAAEAFRLYITDIETLNRVAPNMVQLLDQQFRNKRRLINSLREYFANATYQAGSAYIGMRNGSGAFVSSGAELERQARNAFNRFFRDGQGSVFNAIFAALDDLRWAVTTGFDKYAAVRRILQTETGSKEWINQRNPYVLLRRLAGMPAYARMTADRFAMILMQAGSSNAEMEAFRRFVEVERIINRTKSRDGYLSRFNSIADMEAEQQRVVNEIAERGHWTAAEVEGRFRQTMRDMDQFWRNYVGLYESDFVTPEALDRMTTDYYEVRERVDGAFSNIDIGRNIWDDVAAVNMGEMTMTEMRHLWQEAWEDVFGEDSMRDFDRHIGNIQNYYLNVNYVPLAKIIPDNMIEGERIADDFRMHLRGSDFEIDDWRTQMLDRIYTGVMNHERNYALKNYFEVMQSFGHAGVQFSLFSQNPDTIRLDRLSGEADYKRGAGTHQALYDTVRMYKGIWTQEEINRFQQTYCPDGQHWAVLNVNGVQVQTRRVYNRIVEASRGVNWDNDLLVQNENRIINQIALLNEHSDEFRTQVAPNMLHADEVANQRDVLMDVFKLNPYNLQAEINDRTQRRSDLETNTIVYRDNGQFVVATVHDRSIMTALYSVYPRDVQPRRWARALQILATLNLRMNVTNNPAFWVNNFIGDSWTNAVLGPAGWSINDAMRGIYQSMQRDRVLDDNGRVLVSVVPEHSIMERFIAAGGSQDMSDMEQNIGIADSNRAALQRAFTGSHRVAQGFREFREASENANRLAIFNRVFNRLRQQGYDTNTAALFAAYEARDMLDWGMRGNDYTHLGAFCNAIIAFIPFARSTANGLLRLFAHHTKGAITGRNSSLAVLGITFAKMLAVVALPKVLEAMWYSKWGDDDDDDKRNRFWRFFRSDEMINAYKNETNNRDRYLLVWNNYTHKFIRLKLPFEMGITGAIASRYASHLLGDNPHWTNGLTQAIMNAFSVDEIPVVTRQPVINEIAELGLNYDLYFNSPIVRRSQFDTKSRYLTYTKGTPEWAVKFAKAIHDTVKLDIYPDYIVDVTKAFSYPGLYANDLFENITLAFTGERKDRRSLVQFSDKFVSDIIGNSIGKINSNPNLWSTEYDIFNHYYDALEKAKSDYVTALQNASVEERNGTARLRVSVGPKTGATYYVDGKKAVEGGAGWEVVEKARKAVTTAHGREANVANEDIFDAYITAERLMQDIKGKSRADDALANKYYEERNKYRENATVRSLWNRQMRREEVEAVMRMGDIKEEIREKSEQALKELEKYQR